MSSPSAKSAWFKLVGRPAVDLRPEPLYPQRPEKHKPFPDRPPKPYIAPLKAKAVTIAAGFSCQEGFVFCADRLMAHGGHTDPGAFAHYEEKVFAKRGNYYCALFCGAGETDLLKTVKQQLWTKFSETERENEGEGLPLASIQGILEDILAEIATKIDGVPDVSSLFVARDDQGQFRYLRSDRQIVRPVQGTEILGSGDLSVVRFILDSTHRPDLTLAQTTALAALTVYLSKQYCPQYCGGDTDIYRVFQGEDICEWDAVKRSKIEEIERIFKKSIRHRMLQSVNEAASAVFS